MAMARVFLTHTPDMLPHHLIGAPQGGTGDIDMVRRVTLQLGDSLAYIGGMPAWPGAAPASVIAEESR
jgi:hypothetical protein